MALLYSSVFVFVCNPGWLDHLHCILENRNTLMNSKPLQCSGIRSTEVGPGMFSTKWKVWFLGRYIQPGAVANPPSDFIIRNQLQVLRIYPNLSRIGFLWTNHRVEKTIKKTLDGSSKTVGVMAPLIVCFVFVSKSFHEVLFKVKRPTTTTECGGFLARRS